jgi:CRISPR-associated endonuclease Cas1/CRISPR-associated protein Cas4
MNGQEAGRPAADYVPARMVNEYVYCPRLAFLEWVGGEWDDNLDTVQGRWIHRHVDREVAAAPRPGDTDGEVPPRSRSVTLSSERLKAIARIDLLEHDGDTVVPVDYKRGPVPDVPLHAYDPERVQLCLQGLILRDNGYSCDRGVLYFAASRSRVEVCFDDGLIAQTEAAVAATRALAERGRLPPPLVGSPKCTRCSLHAICLPDEINLLSSATDARPPRLMASSTAAMPLHVQAQGATIGLRGETLIVSTPGEPPVTVRLLDVSSVAALGNVQLTTQAMRALCDRGIPVTLHAASGWLVGVLNGGVGHKHVEVRVRQHAVAADAGGSLRIARRFVEGKILNQRVLVRRNSGEPDRQLLGQLARQARQCRGAATHEQLMGIEGLAARRYFEAFARLFGDAGAWAAVRFQEDGRNRRPPRDEVNAVLSFVYMLLLRDCVLATLAVGFDPYVGFLHANRYGKPSLALDLAEEFRPLVGDSVTITVFNQREVTQRSFLSRAFGVALTPAGRRAVIGAFERRMAHTVVHPVFGYQVSYRRLLELQARLLRAVLLGEVPDYRAFTTR